MINWIEFIYLLSRRAQFWQISMESIYRQRNKLGQSKKKATEKKLNIFTAWKFCNMLI